jgi:hypothetical protein
MVALESFLREPSVVDAELQRGEHVSIGAPSHLSLN